MKFISRYQNSPRIKRQERRIYLANDLAAKTLRDFAVQVSSEINGNSAREDIALIRNWTEYTSYKNFSADILLGTF